MILSLELNIFRGFLVITESLKETVLDQQGPIVVGAADPLELCDIRYLRILIALSLNDSVQLHYSLNVMPYLRLELWLMGV